MRVGITSKLFLAILATCIVVAIAMGVAVRISFEWGFDSYVQEREARRAEALVDVLGDLYRESGSWDALGRQPRRWQQLLRVMPFPDRERDGAPDVGDVTGPHAHPGRPPGPDADHDPAAVPPPPFPGAPPPPMPQPYFLTDMQGVVVAGRAGPGPARTQRRYAVAVDGVQVGWLVAIPLQPPPSDLDARFQSQQMKATWLIGALSVLLAALVSSLLARGLVAPLQRLGQAVRRLADGDHAARVAVASRDELGRLARDVNHLALTLEKNEHLRRDMMADVSHELRTPLAVLRGELEALQDGVRSLTPASLASLQAEVATLSKLIDDLYELSLADVGALRYRMEATDVAGLLRVACGAYRERMAAQGLTLTCDAPDGLPPLRADAQRLTQLLHNLLENALRYTDAGGQVHAAARMQDDVLELLVEDSAPGVPDALLPRLFDRLFRVEASRNRASGGAGLGLAIVARIAQAHGGSAQAQASPLGGVRIVIRLPRTERE